MDNALKELRQIEHDVDGLYEQHAKSLAAITSEYLTKRDKLVKRRSDLVSGKATPSQEELEGYDGSSTDDYARTGGSTHTNSSSSKAGSRGVPYFWLNVLCNQDALAEHITARDRLALEYLTDVRAVHGKDGSVVELHFASNPFFSNKVLKRGGVNAAEEEGGSPLSEIWTDIDWKEGKNLTIKEITKKSSSNKKAKKSKKGGKTTAAEDDSAAVAAPAKRRYKACPSFFRFFSPVGAMSHGSSGKATAGSSIGHDPTALHPDDDESELHEEDSRSAAKRDRDADMARVLLGEVVPRALHIYLSGPLQGSSADEARDEDEDDFEMISGAAGDVADLPPAVQRCVHALGFNQKALDELAIERQHKVDEASKTLQQQLKALYDKRRSLLLPSDDSNSLILPRYWLRVLKASDAAALAITRRDAAVLKYISDISWEWDLQQQASSSSTSSSDQERTGTLRITFLPNPHLATLILTKTYTFQASGNPSDPGTPLKILSSKASPPEWSTPAADRTLRKTKDGKLRPGCSFFNLFKQGAGKWLFNLQGDSKQLQAEANALEVELLLELQGELLPHATACYERVTDSGQDDDGDDDEQQFAEEEEQDEDEDEQDSDADGGDDDDDDEAAAAKAAAKKASKHKAFKISKGHMFLGLMVFILLAEVFVFIDMSGFWRKQI